MFVLLDLRQYGAVWTSLCVSLRNTPTMGRTCGVMMTRLNVHCGDIPRHEAYNLMFYCSDISRHEA
jgi:hypothetical protein